MSRQVGAAVGAGLFAWSALERPAAFLPSRVFARNSCSCSPSSSCSCSCCSSDSWWRWLAPRGSGGQSAGGVPALAMAPTVALVAVAARRRTAMAAVSRKAAAAATGVAAEETVALAPAFDPTSQVGVTQPLGYWDPLGLAKGCDEATFRQYRTAELKHGRVGMLATAGLILQHFWVPAWMDKDMPRGIQALEYPGNVGFAFIVFFAFAVETRDLDEGREPGNFGDPAGVMETGVFGGEPWIKYDEQGRNYELNHGRLAMFAALGSIVAEYASGKDVVEQWRFAKPALIDSIHKTIPWAP